MKKILIGLFTIASISALAEGYNAYIKGGVNLIGGNANETQLDKEKNDYAAKKDWIKGFNLAVEGTYNVNSQVEIGAGVGLISNKAKAFEAKEKPKAADQPVLKNVTLGSYNSIPVYATAKLNIYDQEGIRPYVKGDVGYSFNTGYTETTGIDKVKEFKNLKGGLYVGAAAGVEYQNFIGEVSVKYSGAKATLADDVKNLVNLGNATVSANVGYKLNF